MNSEKCDFILNQYLMLDKNERVPLRLSLHLLFCKKCRNQIKMLRFAEKKIASPLSMPSPVTDETIQKIMDSVSPEMYKKMQKKPVPLVSWIIGGIVLIFLPLISIRSISLMNSRTLSMTYALLIAFCITAYCTVFVFGNIDAFIKKISGKPAA